MEMNDGARIHMVAEAACLASSAWISTSSLCTCVVFVHAHPPISMSTPIPHHNAREQTEYDEGFTLSCATRTEISL
jgi:hypothetical protein